MARMLTDTNSTGFMRCPCGHRLKVVNGEGRCNKCGATASAILSTRWRTCALAECGEVEAERDSEARWASQYAQESHAALSRAEAAEAKLKRYREALEEIAHGDACGAYRVEIARKALEVE